ncbi:MAG TPA: MltA domain-containing protein [Caulobacteraceae bacterium]|nr:MltA domain-containing protein [Caulobacteraceae bacterium]
MRSSFPALAAAGLAALSLAACATTPAPPPKPVVPPPVAAAAPPPALPQTPDHAPPPHHTPAAFAALPGWSDEDHAAALAAFQETCQAASQMDLAIVCARARKLGRVGEADARRFLETNFRPEPAGEPGLLTAYFAPVYQARTAPDAEFSAAVRPRPTDLPAEDAPGGRGAPYASRAEIEARPTADALAWMRPEDLFFLQIQGSGVLTFPDGRREKAMFDGTNGARFSGIATTMRDRGLLADDNTSGEAIRAWLAGHRGPEAQGVMNLNPRYVFFRLGPDDGRDPEGAAGEPLVPGRSVAVDLSRHELGEMFWIDATAPQLAGAFPAYRRLAIALDTGGAIKGDARADLYLGRGPEAGLAAGRVKHTLYLYRLAPLATPRS